MVQTYVLQISAMIFGIFTVKLLSTYLTEDAIGQYFEIRRVTDILIILLTINIGSGIVKYLPEQKITQTYIKKTLIIESIIFLTLIVIVPLVYEYISGRSIHSVGKISKLVMIVYIISLAIVGIFTDILRGLNLIESSNKITIFISFTILATAYIQLEYLNGDLKNFILANATINILAALHAAYQIKNKTAKVIKTEQENRNQEQSIKKTIIYSIARTPASFVYGTIFAWPYIFTSVTQSNEKILTAIGIIMFIIKLFDSIAYPFNYYITPALSRENHLGNEVNKKIQCTLFLILKLVAIMYVIAPSAVKLLTLLIFGNRFSYIANCDHYIAIAGVSWMIFVLLRGILDFYRLTPYSIIIAGTGLAVTMILHKIMPQQTEQLLTKEIAIGMVLMATISYTMTAKFSGQSISLEMVITAIIIGLITYLQKTLIEEIFGTIIDSNMKINIVSTFALVASTTVILGIISIKSVKDIKALTTSVTI